MTKRMSATQLRKELARVQEVAAALQGELATLTNDEKIKALEEAQPIVKPGTPEMANLLFLGYGFTVEMARKVIEERDKNPQTWPLERYEQAQAMLAAYEATPVPTSDRKGWVRDRR